MEHTKKMRQEKSIYLNRPQSLLTNNENVKDPEMVANTLSTFFLMFAENLNLHQWGREYALSLLKDAFPKRLASIKIVPTTETKIESMMHPSNKKNSSGYDEITSKILKTCLSLISCPLSHICNHSLHSGIFPDCLNISVVKPIYKKVTKLV
jgi:hypothetical protein